MLRVAGIDSETVKKYSPLLFVLPDYVQAGDICQLLV